MLVATPSVIQANLSKVIRPLDTQLTELITVANNV